MNRNNSFFCRPCRCEWPSLWFLCFKSAHFNRVLIVSLVCLSFKSFFCYTVPHTYTNTRSIIIGCCWYYCYCLLFAHAWHACAICPSLSNSTYEYSTQSAKKKSKRTNVDIEIMSKSTVSSSSSASELSARKKSK